MRNLPFLKSAHGAATLALLMAIGATGCGREPSAMSDAAAPAGNSMQEATVRSGDVTSRASVLPTTAMSEAVAARRSPPRLPCQRGKMSRVNCMVLLAPPSRRMSRSKRKVSGGDTRAMPT